MILGMAKKNNEILMMKGYCTNGLVLSGLVAQTVTESNRDLFQMSWVQFLPLRNCDGQGKAKEFQGRGISKNVREK